MTGRSHLSLDVTWVAVAQNQLTASDSHTFIQTQLAGMATALDRIRDSSREMRFVT
jgi:hypothetical protein